MTPQYCGTVHSFTVNGSARGKDKQTTLCHFSFKRLTWAVGHWIGAGWCVVDVVAFGYDLDGSAESIDQTVVDPRWIVPAWVKCQRFIVDTGAVAWLDQLTLDVDGTGVTLSLGAAGSSEFSHYLVDGNRAELDCLVRDWPLR